MKKTTTSKFRLLLFAVFFLGGIQVVAQSSVQNELLIRFNAGADPAEIEKLRKELDAVVTGYNAYFDLYLWQIPLSGSGGKTTFKTIIEAAGETRGRAVVDELGLNYRIGGISGGAAVLNYFDLEQYYPIPTCKAYPGDLSVAGGNAPVKVAVIDSGIDMDTHQDLFGPILADTYNFLTNTPDIDDQHGHGTSVSGIIAAGLSEINATMAHYKVLDANGEGDLFHALEAIGRAKEFGAQIINLSWGYRPLPEDTMVPLFETLLQEISKNTLIVVPAGNHGDNLDNSSYYPATFDLEHVFTVGASSCSGQLASFSNQSANHIDLLAPGEDILCPDLHGYWSLKSGTSFSVSVVTTVAAMYASQEENALPGRLLCRLSHSVKRIPGLEGIVATGGVLDTQPESDESSCDLINGSIYEMELSHNPGVTSSSVAVFPNPFHDHVNLQISENTEARGHFMLLNAQGSLIRSGSFDHTSGLHHIQIDLSQQPLPNGVYYLHYQTATQTGSLKLAHLR